jgi:hypothetical protein
MVHLMTARALWPEGPAVFYLGSIAPDAVRGWREKDATHFRDLEDRSEALASLARQMQSELSFPFLSTCLLPPDPCLLYGEGVLLHLFTDWKWDLSYLRAYRRQKGEGWFLPYREELNRAGSWAFHHSDWAKPLWQAMQSVEEFGATPGATAEEVRALAQRNYLWHCEHRLEASAVFPPETLEQFARQTAREYEDWRKRIG